MSGQPSRGSRLRAGARLSRLFPSAFIRFLDHSAAGGILLMVAAALALLVANSPLAEGYFAALKTGVAGLSVLYWINDGLMALFFLLVGLEIKREVLEGRLASWPQRILPGAAALGGMAGPALIYLACNTGPGGHPAGWAIPAATDIAFALGVLSLLGSRVPVSLKVFLTALAIIDDLGAVLIIAFFYTGAINLPALAGAVAVTAALAWLNCRGVTRLAPYLLLGLLLWALVLGSGVHATLAGVVLALCIPLRPGQGRTAGAEAATEAVAAGGAGAGAASPLHTLEHAISPWVTFLVVPVFGFANAGVSLAGVSPALLLEPVPLGVMLGLVLGKQLGIFLAVVLVVRLGWAALPAQAGWRQVYGVALLCGIGFTMSLFIGLLAFPGAPLLQDEVKVGVLLGSLLSALAGTLVLRRAS